MDNLDEMFVNECLSRFKTNDLKDSLIQAKFLALCKGNPELYAKAKKTILGHRKDWLAWRFNNQRQWQTTDVNHHHDSFELRESYIAPHNIWSDEEAFESRARNYNKIRKPELYKKG